MWPRWSGDHEDPKSQRWRSKHTWIRLWRNTGAELKSAWLWLSQDVRSAPESQGECDEHKYTRRVWSAMSEARAKIARVQRLHACSSMWLSGCSQCQSDTHITVKVRVGRPAYRSRTLETPKACPPIKSTNERIITNQTCEDLEVTNVWRCGGTLHLM